MYRTLLYTPLSWIHSDGAGVLHASGHEGGPQCPIQLCHLNLVQITVDPVQIPRYPIHSQTLRSGQAMLDDYLYPRDTLKPQEIPVRRG